jgi:hypothetical protein
MELGNFVENALLQIMEGIQRAQTEWHNRKDTKGGINISCNGIRNAVAESKTVKFDIAITAENSVSGEGAGSLKVVGFADLKAEGTLEHKKSVISRVQFEVPITPALLELDASGQAS